MANLIPPRTLSGFRDYLPDVMLAREKVLDTFRRVARGYGFTPIDTPACEALDVLLGKGGDESDKLVYRVLSARGEKAEMGLRFDLTVPFARFAAQHINGLGTPFKRYAAGPVWRGERPGHGRYREFWQCDFDTIGTTSNAADIETALVINDLFAAIGFDRFEVRINNRLVLNGLLEKFGISDRSVFVLRAIDKLPKIGRENVITELVLLNTVQADSLGEYIWVQFFSMFNPRLSEARVFDDVELAQLEGEFTSKVVGHWLTQNQLEPLLPLLRAPVSEFLTAANWTSTRLEEEGPRLRAAFKRRVTGLSRAQADNILDLVTTPGTNLDVLAALERDFGDNKQTAEGIRRLRELLAVANTAGVPEGRFRIDLSICRGLDYYTGTIYETFLTDLPGIGSVCSGGRYDNLASLYTKQVLPGVGASLGLDRLITAMEELKHPLLTGQTTPAEVLVVQFDAARVGDYQRVARALRAAGVAAEVYPDAKKIGVQLGYAEKRGFRLALIAGPAEFDQGVWKVKDLAKREETTVPEAELVKVVCSRSG